AVRSGDFGIQGRDELLVLTNWHVLNRNGLNGVKDFSNVEVVFEALAETAERCGVREIVAESPAEEGLDYALLRLKRLPPALKPMDLTETIARVMSNARVYVIGYPRG